MVKSKKTILFFLSTIPKDFEDKLLYVCLCAFIAVFIIIKIINVFILIQIKNGECATTACPDMTKISFAQLPLSIKIMEISRPLGGTLSLMIFEIIIIIINGKLKKNTKFLIYGSLVICSIKTFISLLEAASNLDSGKYIRKGLTNGLNFTNSFFILIEILILYGIIPLIYYRYRIQLNDNFFNENEKINLLKKSLPENNLKNKGEDSDATTVSDEDK
ncbi:Hypothetical protein SRAE_2000523300 [Strongyloides ratti]|uniref:Uncharacterized protein n=1 Tax=Strongyloides ratti TaxID=34506 RepID=A0A090LSM4_STRRB|nr:Hypothetical protein SRAE_2000523300 [Strongyloides ratti]CEF70608.1 Hypothetical protein SRAE_2000523300 [Strongyloides ratti]